MGYDFLYKLKPLYEDLKRGGEGWYRLEWKPIKNGTYNLYISKTFYSWSCHMIGIRTYNCNAHNGWHRAWDGVHLELGFYFFTINFWIIWNILCHKDGPSDVDTKKPLIIVD